MKLNIKEFIQLRDKCMFCGSFMHYKLISDHKPNFRVQQYAANNWHYLYDTYVPNNREQYEATYTSLIENDKLTFYYEFNNRKCLILSIDINTGKIYGELDKIQKVLWDHTLHLAGSCLNSNTHKESEYRCFSTPLVLERKNSVIMPIDLYAELLTHNKFHLGTDYEHKRTNLMNDNFFTIKTLPLIEQYKIVDGETAIQKIKTILVFQ